MTGWLVDTHVLLWAWGDVERLSEPARAVLADPRAPLVVSTVTLWEIAVKRGLGKLRVPKDYPAMLDDGFTILPVLAQHAHAVAELPTDRHRDPFDRMLAVQSKVESLPIISADEAFDQYKVARLW
ncbi:MAG: type II toxin-antitoxin system VapC family toxin [Patulibacter minatonensis]